MPQKIVVAFGVCLLVGCLSACSDANGGGSKPDAGAGGGSGTSGHAGHGGSAAAGSGGDHGGAGTGSAGEGGSGAEKDASTTELDGAVADASTSDAGMDASTGGGNDAGTDSGNPANDAGTDAGPDAGMAGNDAGMDASNGTSDAGTDSGTSGDPDMQIADVIAAADGSALSLPIHGVFVTYEKPLLGNESAGFFLQASASGAAIFVAIDPAALSPAPRVGDEVALVVTTLTTQAGMRVVTGVSGYQRLSTGNAIAPLVSDLSNASDLVSNLAAYRGKVVKLTGSITAAFTYAGTPQVAADFATTGVPNDANLRVRMPDAVRSTYDLEAGCDITLDYGVMWGFNAVAEPSALHAGDISAAACPAPQVVSAIALSATQVQVTFDRLLDASSVSFADFTFDNGLSATAAIVSISGKDVVVTTTMQTANTAYTLTVANVDDVLGASVNVNAASAVFTGYVQVAGLLINEISPAITGSHDLVELRVTSAGTINGVKLLQIGSATETLATLPNANVAAGDLIVIHLVGSTATGAAPASETTGKSQYAYAMYTANYDTAWDVLDGTTGLTNGNRVLELQTVTGTVLDAVPVVLSSSGSPPAAFPGVLQTLQANNLWLPVDCGGQPCTYVSTPTAIAISVDYLGVGTSATGNSVARKPGFNTRQKSDWNAAAAQSFGLPNP